MTTPLLAGPSGPGRAAVRRSPHLLLAIPALGAAAVLAGGAVALTAAAAGVLVITRADLHPGHPANVYAWHHYGDVYLIGHPVLMAACAVAVAAATALAVTRRWTAAVLLLCAAALLPLVPAGVFLGHIWQLTPGR
jgi:hypothetical protein